MKILKAIRRLFFGPSAEETMEMLRQIREADKCIKEKYLRMEDIRNTPIPRCDGTYK